MALAENWCMTTRSGLSRSFEMMLYVSGFWLSYAHWFRAKCLSAQLYRRSWLWYVKPMFYKLFQSPEHLDVMAFPAQQQENNFLVMWNGIHISLLTQNMNMLSHCDMDSTGWHTFFFVRDCEEDVHFRKLYSQILFCDNYVRGCDYSHFSGKKTRLRSLTQVFC